MTEPDGAAPQPASSMPTSRPAWREAASLLFGKTRAADAPRADGIIAQKWVRDGLEFIRFLGGAAAVYLLLTTFIFRTFYIPSSSMEPTLELRDRVLVLNFAYGFSKYSAQFGLLSWMPGCEARKLNDSCRIFGGKPRRGDVVVFFNPERREHLIKRVIGLPGDVVQMREGHLWLNNEPVPREQVGLVRYRSYMGPVVEPMLYSEMLPDDQRPHPIYELGDQSVADDTIAVTVKPGHIFVMGDNRDNSNDSRSSQLGQVPMENLVGKAMTVFFTFHSCEKEPGLVCPKGRVWKPL
jgi:signal peptidase I